MITSGYKIGDKIKNEYGLELQVQEIESPSDKTIGEADSCYKTFCTECCYLFEKVAENLQKQRFCAGCAVKSAILKFDTDGSVSSISGMNVLEYAEHLMEKYNISEPEAYDVIIEIFKRRPERVRRNKE